MEFKQNILLSLKSLRLLLNSWAEIRDCLDYIRALGWKVSHTHTHTYTRIHGPGKEYKSTRNSVDMAPPCFFGSFFIRSFVLLSPDICMCFACDSKQPVNRATTFRAIATWAGSDRKLARPEYSSGVAATGSASSSVGRKPTKISKQSD